MLSMEAARKFAEMIAGSSWNDEYARIMIKLSPFLNLGGVGASAPQQPERNNWVNQRVHSDNEKIDSIRQFRQYYGNLPDKRHLEQNPVLMFKMVE
jgi:hypothetical protein